MRIKNKITSILFVSLTVLAACNYDYSEDLSGNYFYMDEAPDHITINGKNDIWSRVEAYSYDDNYILAIQRPLVKYYRSVIGARLRGDHLSKNPQEDTEKSEIIADSIIKHDPYYQKIFSRPFNYWIISHQLDSLFGPLSKEEYFQKRKELGVPEGLKLEFENAKF